MNKKLARSAPPRPANRLLQVLRLLRLLHQMGAISYPDDAPWDGAIQVAIILLQVSGSGKRRR